MNFARKQRGARRVPLMAAVVSVVSLLSLAWAPIASANGTWELCNRKVLQGSTSYTTFCVTWVASADAQGRVVVRPTLFDVESTTNHTIYVTKEDIGKQDSTGNHIKYTDGANQTIPPQYGVFYLPSSSAYWIIDKPDGSDPRADGQAFVNVWLAVAGHPYEAITVYDTP
jgi:hypothetical protein